MVQIKVSDGVLEGELLENAYGGQIYSFKGIPYAEPPIGDLRFKAPQPAKPWDGVRPAKQHGPVCAQYDFIYRKAIVGSEDCLYVNVYSPDVKPSKPLPVMVWIHGGAFIVGDGNDETYGPEFLVRHGVVLVTFNYRLGVIGFLSLDTADIPGNAGMKDQVAALRWVQKNIAAFGGNPDNVTIFGESAGGASVSFHLLSPMSKGLFKRAISQSGTANCTWANAFEARERALGLARNLGCDAVDDKSIFEFLKSQPIETLLKVKLPILMSETVNTFANLQLNIVSEHKFGDNERFFYGDVLDILRKGIHEGVEVMNGFTADEGLCAFLFSPDIYKSLDQGNNFLEVFLPGKIQLNCNVKEQLNVARKLKGYYMKNNAVSAETLLQFSDYHSINMFVYASMLWQKICASRNKNKLFLYKFSCHSERNFMIHEMKQLNDLIRPPVVAHADDLPYLFPFKIAPIPPADKNLDTFKMVNNVTALWTNFAKYGNPTPDDSLGVQWLPYDLDSESYLDIGRDLVPGTKVDEEELQFWNNIYKKYLPEWAFPE